MFMFKHLLSVNTRKRERSSGCTSVRVAELGFFFFFKKKKQRSLVDVVNQIDSRRRKMFTVQTHGP